MRIRVAGNNTSPEFQGNVREALVSDAFDYIVKSEKSGSKKVTTHPCPVCDSTVKGDFPADMPGPLQYGLGLKAYVINLMICHMVAINRVQNWLNP